MWTWNFSMLVIVLVQLPAAVLNLYTAEHHNRYFFDDQCPLSFDNGYLSSWSQRYHATKIYGACDDPISTANKIGIQWNQIIRFNQSHHLSTLCRSYSWTYHAYQRKVAGLAGLYDLPGYVDAVGADARFNSPTACASYHGNPNVYISDKLNQAMRVLNVLTQLVMTLQLNFTTSPFHPHDVAFISKNLITIAEIKSDNFLKLSTVQVANETHGECVGVTENVTHFGKSAIEGHMMYLSHDKSDTVASIVLSDVDYPQHVALCNFSVGEVADVDSMNDTIYGQFDYDRKLIRFHSKPAVVERSGRGIAVIDAASCSVDHVSMPIRTSESITFHIIIGQDLLVYTTSSTYMIKAELPADALIEPPDGVTFLDYGLQRQHRRPDETKYGFGTVQGLCRHPYEDQNVLLMVNNQIAKGIQRRDSIELFANYDNLYGHIDGSNLSTVQFASTSSCASILDFDIVLIADTWNKAIRVLHVEDELVETLDLASSSFVNITDPDAQWDHSAVPHGWPKVIEFITEELALMIDSENTAWRISLVERRADIFHHSSPAAGVDIFSPLTRFHMIEDARHGNYSLVIATPSTQTPSSQNYNLITSVEDIRDGDLLTAKLMIKPQSKILYFYGYYVFITANGALLTFINATSYDTTSIRIDTTKLGRVYDMVSFAQGQILLAGDTNFQILQLEKAALQTFDRTVNPSRWLYVTYSAESYNFLEGYKFGGLCMHPWFRNHVIVLAENAIFRLRTTSLWNATLLAGQPYKRGYKNGPGELSLFREPSDCAALRDHHLVYVTDTGNNAVRLYNLLSKQVTTNNYTFLEPRGVELVDIHTLVVQHNLTYLTIIRNLGQTSESITVLEWVKWWVPAPDSILYVFGFSPNDSSVLSVKIYDMEAKSWDVKGIFITSAHEQDLRDDDTSLVVGDVTDPNIIMKGWYKESYNYPTCLMFPSRQGTLISFYNLDGGNHFTHVSSSSDIPIKDIQYMGDGEFIAVSHRKIISIISDDIFRTRDFGEGLIADLNHTLEQRSASYDILGFIGATCPYPHGVETDFVLLESLIYLSHPYKQQLLIGGFGDIGLSGENITNSSLWSFRYPESCSTHYDSPWMIIADSGNDVIRGFRWDAEHQMDTLLYGYSNANSSDWTPLKDPRAILFISATQVMFVTNNSRLVLLDVELANTSTVVSTTRIFHWGLSDHGQFWMLSAGNESAPVLALYDCYNTTEPNYSIKARYHSADTPKEVTNGLPNQTSFYLPDEHKTSEIVERDGMLYLITSLGQYLTVIDLSGFSTTTIRQVVDQLFRGLTKNHLGEVIAARQNILWTVTYGTPEKFELPNQQNETLQTDLYLQREPTTNWGSITNTSPTMHQATSICTHPLVPKSVFTTHGCALGYHVFEGYTNPLLSWFWIGDMFQCGYAPCTHANASECRFYRLDSCAGNPDRLTLYIADTGNSAIRYVKYYNGWSTHTLAHRETVHNPDVIIESLRSPTTLTMLGSDKLVYLERGTSLIYQINLVTHDVIPLTNSKMLKQWKLLWFGPSGDGRDLHMIMHDMYSPGRINWVESSTLGLTFQESSINITENTSELQSGSAAKIQSNLIPGRMIEGNGWTVFTSSEGRVLTSYSKIHDEVNLTQSSGGGYQSLSQTGKGSLFALTDSGWIESIQIGGFPTNFSHTLRSRTPLIKSHSWFTGSGTRRWINGICEYNGVIYVIYGHCIRKLHATESYFYGLIGQEHIPGDELGNGANARFTHPTQCTAFGNGIMVIDFGNYKLKTADFNYNVFGFSIPQLNISQSRIHTIQRWSLDTLVLLMSNNTHADHLVVYNTSAGVTYVQPSAPASLHLSFGLDPVTYTGVIFSQDPETDFIVVDFFNSYDLQMQSLVNFSSANTYSDVRDGAQAESIIMPTGRKRVVVLNKYWVYISNDGWSLTIIDKLRHTTSMYYQEIDQPINSIIRQTPNSLVISYGFKIVQLQVAPPRTEETSNYGRYNKVSFDLLAAKDYFCSSLDLIANTTTTDLERCALACYKRPQCFIFNYFADTKLCELNYWTALTRSSFQPHSYCYLIL